VFKGKNSSALRMSFGISQQHLIYCQGNPELLQQFLARETAATPPSGWDEPAVKALIESLPPGYNGITGAKPGAMAEMMIRGLGMANPKLSEGAPNRELLQRFFGPAAAATYRTPDSILVRFISLDAVK
jgi:hypothetical protein